MNHRVTKSIVLAATAALLAGCSASPTITVPNPLAVFNGAFTPPTVASVPQYTTQQVIPASNPTYIVDQPSVAGSSYGIAAPSYGTVAPNYTVNAPSYSTGMSYGNVMPVQASAPTINVPTAPAINVPTFGSAQPVQNVTNTYGLGTPSMTVTNPVSTGATFGTSYSQPMPVQASTSQTMVQTYNSVQPALNTASSYGLNVPTMSVAEPVSMGGSFQTLPVTQPAMGGGVATYQSAPTTVALPAGASITY